MSDAPTHPDDLVPDVDEPEPRPSGRPDFARTAASPTAEKVDHRKVALRQVADKVLDKPDLGREDSFTTFSQLVQVILGVEVSAVQAVLIMDALKTARLIDHPEHVDSWIDKAGYAVCAVDHIESRQPMEG